MTTTSAPVTAERVREAAIGVRRMSSRMRSAAAATSSASIASGSVTASTLDDVLSARAVLDDDQARRRVLVARSVVSEQGAAAFEVRTLDVVRREPDRPIELRRRLRVAPEPRQQFAPRDVEVAVAVEIERVELVESGLRPVTLTDGDGPVEGDDGVGAERVELVVER